MRGLKYYMGLNYKIEIVKNREEGGYALSCPELPGCITSAETIEEGIEAIEDVKKACIKSYLADNIRVPEPGDYSIYSGQLKLKIPKSLHKSLVERSIQEDVSVSQYCLYLLSDGVNNGKNPRSKDLN